ncbi:hypothetical protein BGZ47_008742 [Haplosporangium gracile]|nr:hypothetical protein BGZ47_008742 [Haplosporangium gracile]
MGGNISHSRARMTMDGTHQFNFKRLLFTNRSMDRHIYKQLRLYSDGSQIASTSLDKTVRLREVNFTVGPGFDSSDLFAIRFCGTYSPDGQRLISGRYKRSVQQLDSDTGDIDFIFPDELRNAACLVFSPDALQIAL